MQCIIYWIYSNNSAVSLVLTRLGYTLDVKPVALSYLWQGTHSSRRVLLVCWCRVVLYCGILWQLREHSQVNRNNTTTTGSGATTSSGEVFFVCSGCMLWYTIVDRSGRSWGEVTSQVSPECGKVGTCDGWVIFEGWWVMEWGNGWEMITERVTWKVIK